MSTEKQFICKHSFRLVGPPTKRKNYLEQNVDTDIEHTKSLIIDVGKKVDAELNSIFLYSVPLPELSHLKSKIEEYHFI